MCGLELQHPEIHSEFLEGNFTITKTGRPFSAMAIDQAHEQNNAAVKGDRGAIGLTESPVALRRWMLCGPEMARIIDEFESSKGDIEIKSNMKHHQQTTKVQTKFRSDVISLKVAFNEMGNPFKDLGGDLVILDSRDVVDKNVAEKSLDWQNLENSSMIHM